MHFKHISAKTRPKNLILFIIRFNNARQPLATLLHQQDVFIIDFSISVQLNPC